MKSSTLLKVSFGVILFHILGHTIGHFTWKKTDDKILSGLISQMYSHQFNFMGKYQTLGGHHDGYSLLFEIMLLMLAAITWIISSRIIESRDLKPIILITGIALITAGIIEFVYFFALAGGSSFLAGIINTLVYLRESKKQPSHTLKA